MKELTTTLNKMRDCLDYWVRTSEWEGLLMHLGKTEADDEPLLLQAILGSSHGTSGAIWALITIAAHNAVQESINAIKEEPASTRFAAEEAAEAATRAAYPWFIDAHSAFRWASHAAWHAPKYALDGTGFAAWASAEAAYSAALDDFKREFLHLCRLEGAYGVVAAREQGERQ